MPRKLSEEEIVTLKVLHAKGQSNCEIAQLLGVTEGAVRYHIRRAGVPDGRRNKPRKAEKVAGAIEYWFEGHQARGGKRPANVRSLYEWLVCEHRYQGSYKSVLRYVRSKYPRPKLRPFRRVETPPGAQSQVDWGEAMVDIGDGLQKLYCFVMVLSHSRKEVLIWSRSMNQLAWHHVHNEAFGRLRGVAAVVRIDNLKTGVSRGAGPWGEINASYRAYARCVGFHVDPCLPKAPEDKGKAENHLGRSRARLDLWGKRFDGLAGLQAYTDEELDRDAHRRICPATGRSVHETWLMELRHLRPVERLPEVFDVAVTRRVQKDCTVHFEGRSYSVPFRLCGLSVEVRGCVGVVQIVDDDRVVAEHPRATAARLLIDPWHYEGGGDERVDPPMPLGKMGRRLQEIVEMPVERRPLDLYAALAEVAR